MRWTRHEGAVVRAQVAAAARASTTGGRRLRFVEPAFFVRRWPLRPHTHCIASLRDRSRFSYINGTPVSEQGKKKEKSTHTTRAVKEAPCACARREREKMGGKRGERKAQKEEKNARPAGRQAYQAKRGGGKAAAALSRARP